MRRSGAVALAPLVLALFAARAAAEIDASGVCATVTGAQASKGWECDVPATLRSLREEAAGRPFLGLEEFLFHNASRPLEELAQAEELVFRPRQDVPAWTLELPVDWAVDPFGDRNWRYQLNAWRPIEPYLVLYERRGEARYLRIALRVIEDWMRFNVVERRPNPFAWYDMAVGLRALSLGYLLDRGIREGSPLSIEEQALLVRAAGVHLDRLLKPGVISPTNHGLFQLHGAMALCRSLPSMARCPQAEVHVQREMMALISGQFNLELMHLEHSPEYHFFVSRQIGRILESGWYEEMAELIQLLDLIEGNRRWLVHPDGQIVPVGDTSGSARVRLDLPPGRSGCDQRDGFRSDCFVSRAFYETGYGIVRSDWATPAERASMLFLTAAFHSRVHKHADDLSFELFEAGRRVLVDAGKYGYERDEMREYVTSTRAHNTVEIDGQSYSLDLENAYGSGLRGLYRYSWGFLLEGEVDHPRLRARHRRALLYRPGEWLVVLDRLTSDRRRSFTQWFHFHPDLAVAAAEGRTTASAPDGFELLLDQAADTTDCGWQLERGAREPRIQGWTAERYRVMVASDALGYTCSARELRLAAVFRLAPSVEERAPAVASFPGPGGVELSFVSDGPVAIGFDFDQPAEVTVSVPR